MNKTGSRPTKNRQTLKLRRKMQKSTKEMNIQFHIDWDLTQYLKIKSLWKKSDWNWIEKENFSTVTPPTLTSYKIVTFSRLNERIMIYCSKSSYVSCRMPSFCRCWMKIVVNISRENWGKYDNSAAMWSIYLIYLSDHVHIPCQLLEVQSLDFCWFQSLL